MAGAGSTAAALHVSVIIIDELNGSAVELYCGVPLSPVVYQSTMWL